MRVTQLITFCHTRMLSSGYLLTRTKKVHEKHCDQFILPIAKAYAEIGSHCAGCRNAG